VAVLALWEMFRHVHKNQPKHSLFDPHVNMLEKGAKFVRWTTCVQDQARETRTEAVFRFCISLCNLPIRSDSEDHLKIFEFVWSDMTRAFSHKIGHRASKCFDYLLLVKSAFGGTGLLFCLLHQFRKTFGLIRLGIGSACVSVGSEELRKRCYVPVEGFPCAGTKDKEINGLAFLHIARCLVVAPLITLKVIEWYFQSIG